MPIACWHYRLETASFSTELTDLLPNDLPLLVMKALPGLEEVIQNSGFRRFGQQQGMGTYRRANAAMSPDQGHKMGRGAIVTP